MRGRGRPAGERHAVDVGQGAARPLLRLPVDGQVLRDLAVRPGVGDLDGALDVAEERRRAEQRREIRHEPRHGEGETAALAVTGGDDPGGVDPGQCPGLLDGAYRVAPGAAAAGRRGRWRGGGGRRAPERCLDELLLFFHHVPYGHVLRNGSTVIQHIYDTHFDGAEQVVAMRRMWEGLAGRLDPGVYDRVRERLDEQLRCAQEWRDQVNAYFFRKSWVPDARGRPLH